MQVPPLHRYYWRAQTSCRLSHPTSFPRAAVPSVRPFFRSLRSGTGLPKAWCLLASPRSPLLILPMETTGSPRFLGNPSRKHAPLFYPGGPTNPRLYRAGRCCLPSLQKRQPHDVGRFRGSITRPAYSLSTLRRMSYPTTAQDSLPARWLGFDGVGLAPTGFHSQISRRHRLPPFPMSQASPGAL